MAISKLKINRSSESRQKEKKEPTRKGKNVKKSDEKKLNILKKELSLEKTKNRISSEIDNIQDNSNNTKEAIDKILKLAFRELRPAEASIFTYDPHSKRIRDGFTRLSRGSITQKQEHHKKIALNSINRKKDQITKETICLTLKINRKILGAIVVKGKASKKFKDEDQIKIKTIASHTDSTIHHFNNLNELMQKKKETETIYKIDKIRDESEDLRTMIRKTLEEILNTLNAKIGFVMLRSEPKNEFKIEVKGTAEERSIKNLHLIGKESVNKRKLIAKENINRKIRSAIAIPLVFDKRIIGVFGVANPKDKDHFDSYDTRLLGAISSQADTAILEDFEKQKIKDIFKRYVSEEIVEEMLNSKKDFLSGRKLDMSVLFADIRGFTSIAEKIKDPKTLVTKTNHYLENMVEVILNEEGTIDKFVGDEVMALFGTPVQDKQHPEKAIKTAIRMQKKMQALRKKKKTNFKIGIGINSGIMIAGNIGCEKMTDYTVLGDNVNTGARICGIAAENQILVSENTYKKTKNKFRFRKLKPIKVKGKLKPLKVYEVIY